MEKLIIHPPKINCPPSTKHIQINGKEDRFLKLREKTALYTMKQPVTLCKYSDNWTTCLHEMYTNLTEKNALSELHQKTNLAEHIHSQGRRSNGFPLFTDDVCSVAAAIF